MRTRGHKRAGRIALGLGLGQGFGGASSGPATLIADNFTGTNGADLAVHAIAPTNTPATSWTVLVGSFAIQNNKLQASTNGYNRAVADAGVADCTVSVTINSTGANRDDLSGPIVRATDVSNFWYFSPWGATTFRLTERAAGVETTRATGLFSVQAGVDYTATLVCTGSTITGYVNGVQILQYTSATFNQAATKHGINVYHDVGSGYDQTADTFQVTAP